MIRLARLLALLFTPALAGAEPPSRDWHPRHLEFERISGQRPYPEAVRTRLIELLRTENALVRSLDEAGEAGALGEGYSEYVAELASVVLRLARKGDREAALALIPTPFAASDAFGQLLESQYWREWLAFELQVPASQPIFHSMVPAHIGRIYGLHKSEMDPQLRQKVERRLVESLESNDLATRLNALEGVSMAGLKAALPSLRQWAERMSAARPGNEPGSYELREVRKAIAVLEKLP